MDDHGTDSEASVDYPPICVAVGRAVAEGRADRSIVRPKRAGGSKWPPTKFRGASARPCATICYTARLSREHNDANVLSMGGRIVAFGLADEILGAQAEDSVRGRPPPEPLGSDHGGEAA